MRRKKTIYAQLLGCLIKNGKKKKAKKILNTALSLASFNKGVTKVKILRGILYKLRCATEARKVKSRKRVTVIPFPLSLNRQLFLVSKWLLEAAKKDTRHISTSVKLSDEFINVLNGNKSLASTRKDHNVTESMWNRSNLHFRW